MTKWLKKHHPKNKSKLQRRCGALGLLLLFSAAFTGCASLRANYNNAEAYTRMNKITLGTMITAQLADAITTDLGIKAGAIERNPLLGRRPDTQKIFIFSAVGIALKWYGGHLLPAKWRNWIWGTATVINTGAAINNYNVYQEQK